LRAGANAPVSFLLKGDVMKKSLTMLVFCCLFGAMGAQAAKKPNIVFMLSDNLGYGDLGSYGGGIIRGAATPRLDQLAAEGTRFTNFNVEAECTPSRAALMTGRYALRTGNTRAIPVPGIPQGLAPWEYTMAEMLKDSGYDTAMLGKWHIGASKGRMPTDQGFDQWWGFPNSTDVARFPTVVGFPKGLLPKFYILEGTAKKGLKPVGEYSLERRPFIDATMADKAADYIKAQKGNDKPFFLYIAWSLVHHPSMPHPDFAGKTGNGRYADVLAEHDHRVGQVLDALKAAGLEEDTLVVYASDNGPDRAEYPHIGDTGPFRGYLGSLHEGSVRTPMFMRWPQQVPTGRASNEIVSIHDFMPTFARLAGGKLPKDRAIDGRDQSAFFLGKQDKSARHSVLYFHDDTLLAMKWNQFKIYLQHESPEREDHRYADLWAPKVFDTHIDPKETNNLVNDGYLWLMGAIMQDVIPFGQSVQRYGLVQPGGDKPVPAEVKIPFFKNEWFARALKEMAAVKKAQKKQ
jgi:arylsulfatase